MNRQPPATEPTTTAPGWMPGPARSNWDPTTIAEQEAEERRQQLAHWSREWAIVRRLNLANINHATAAWQNRISMPLAPHALVFLYHQPGPDGGVEVSAATKIWHAGVPDSDRPIGLIGTVIDEVARNISRPADEADDDAAAEIVDTHRGGRRSRRPSHTAVWDVRSELCDNADDGMRADAVYAGVGYSTLDTAAGSFAQRCQQERTRTQLDIPGAFCWVANPSGSPADHQVLTAERAAKSDLGNLTIHSHGALSSPPIASVHPYSHLAWEIFYSDAWRHHEMLRAMWHLDQLLRRLHPSSNGRDKS